MFMLKPWYLGKHPPLPSKNMFMHPNPSPHTVFDNWCRPQVASEPDRDAPTQGIVAAVEGSDQEKVGVIRVSNDQATFELARLASEGELLCSILSYLSFMVS